MILVVILILFCVGDIAGVIIGINDWKKKIEAKQTSELRKNIWRILFYLIAILLIALTIYSYGLFP
jgi:hypothetical protein